MRHPVVKKPLSKVWNEHQISNAYNQPTQVPTCIHCLDDADCCDMDDCENLGRILPHRYLKQWYLVQVPATDENDHHHQSDIDDGDEDDDGDTNNSTTANRKNSDVYLFQYGKRVALPESGTFPSNVVLYGWIQPTSPVAVQDKDTTCFSQHHELVFVKLDNLDRWVLNRSKEHRGYWIVTRHATYWLHEPCSYRPKVPLSPSSASAPLHKVKKRRHRLLTHCINRLKEISGGGKQAHTSQPKKKRGRTPKSSSSSSSSEKHGETQAKENASTLAESSSNTRSSVHSSSSSSKGQSQAQARILASQEQIHLQHRLCLGILSIFINAIANMNDEKVQEISQLNPPAFLSLLLQEQRQCTNDDASALLDWNILRPHGYFLGSNLVLLHTALTIRSPLLLGFLQADRVEGGGIWQSPPSSEASAAATTRKDSNNNEDDSDDTTSGTLTKTQLTEFAIQAETWTRQKLWGEPLSSSFNNNVSKDDNSNRKSNKSSKKRFLGVKKVSDSQSVLSVEDLCNIGFITCADNECNLDEPATPMCHETPSKRKKRKSVRWEDIPEPLVDEAPQEETRQMETGEVDQSQHNEEFSHEGAVEVEQLLQDDVSHEDATDAEVPQQNEAGQNLNRDIIEILDSDSEASATDEFAQSEESLDIEEREQEEGVRFQIRRGTRIINVDVNDLSMSMKHVMGIARTLGTRGGGSVFGWTAAERQGLKKGTLAMQIRVGLAFFTTEHFGELSARDVTEMAPMSPIVLPDTCGSGGQVPPLRKVILDLELVPA